MRPSRPSAGKADLFRERLDTIINPRHSLVRLAGLVPWDRFDDAFGGFFKPVGRTAKPTRRALERVALLATLAEIALSRSLKAERQAAGIATACDDRVAADMGTAARVLPVLAAGLYGLDLVAGRCRHHSLGTAAGAAVLGGSLLLRLSEIRGARASAARAEDTFRLRQPR